MNDRPNPFDKFGNITNLPEDQIADFDEDTRTDYFVMVSASLAERDAAQAVEDGRSNLAAIVAKCRDLQATFDAEVMKPNQVDELRKVILAQNAARLGLPYESPKPDKRAVALKKKIEDAETEQSNARQLVYRLELELKNKRDELSKAISRWQHGRTVPPHEAYREHLRRLKEYEANGGQFVEAPNMGPASHLDAVLGSGAGGRHLGINRGTGSSVRRRGTMVPKLPSQR
jgi:hypothetical protein